MIYTSFDEAIGPLIEVRTFVGTNGSDYCWRALVFKNGLLVQQFYDACWGESRDDTYDIATHKQPDMPKDLHELIKAHTPIPTPPTAMELAQQENERLRQFAATQFTMKWTGADGSTSYYNSAYDKAYK